jgi:hypothetical protein
MVTELSPSASKGTAMSATTKTTAAGTQAVFSQPVFSQPVFSQQGRKGIAYDWQSLYAAAEAADLDEKFAALTPALAE